MGERKKTPEGEQLHINELARKANDVATNKGDYFEKDSEISTGTTMKGWQYHGLDRLTVKAWIEESPKGIKTKHVEVSLEGERVFRAQALEESTDYLSLVHITTIPWESRITGLANSLKREIPARRVRRRILPH